MLFTRCISRARQAVLWIFVLSFCRCHHFKLNYKELPLQYSWIRTIKVVLCLGIVLHWVLQSSAVKWCCSTVARMQFAWWAFWSSQWKSSWHPPNPVVIAPSSTLLLAFAVWRLSFKAMVLPPFCYMKSWAVSVLFTIAYLC